jgi:hypothetical protein
VILHSSDRRRPLVVRDFAHCKVPNPNLANALPLHIEDPVEVCGRVPAPYRIGTYRRVLELDADVAFSIVRVDDVVRVVLLAIVVVVGVFTIVLALTNDLTALSVNETRHHHVPPIVSRLHERCGLALDVSPLLGIWVVEMFGEIVVCIPLLLQEESLLASETPELTRCRNGMFVNVANRYDLIVQHGEEWHCARQNVFLFSRNKRRRL